jgi:hypothetical protein
VKPEGVGSPDWLPCPNTGERSYTYYSFE